MAKYPHTNNRSFEDRFIPRRTGQDFQHFNMNFYLESNFEIKPEARRYINYGRQIIQKELLQQRLLDVIGPKTKKVFSFSKLSSKSTRANFEEDWPVKPRKKACIKCPTYLLNMPNIQLDLYKNVIDWSSGGRIAAICKRSVYTWEPEQQSTILEGEIDGKVRGCIKFNTTGKLLAVSLLNRKFSVANPLTGEMHVFECFLEGRAPIATSLEWLKDDTLIIGTSRGLLLKAYVSMKDKKSKNSFIVAHSRAIISIKKSCNETYLATSGLDSLLKIWTLSDFQVWFEVKLFSPIKAVAWHPWKEPFIAFPGGSDNNILTLWNIGSAKEVHTYDDTADVLIDALTFNSLSGELVVSCFNKITFKSYILILASFTRMTDLIEWHSGRILYLIWSGNHKKLLTVGADEALCIWNFFEERKQKKWKNPAKLTLSSICIR